MTMGMTGFTFSGGTEHSGNIVEAFDVSFVREVKVTTIGLRFASKSVFQMAFGFRAFELHDVSPLQGIGCKI
jgi:hypothetical protein